MGRSHDKLEDAKIAEIRRLRREAHLSDQKIADRVGCSKATAQKYLAAGTNGQGEAPSPPAADPRTGRWTPDQPPLEPHTLADLFPAMADQDLNALAPDIAAHGAREPIWLYQGRILDGRNRFRVCQALVIACPTREYTGDDPLSFVLSMNLQRRHLTESQRAMVAEKLATMRQGARTDVQPPANLPEVSTAQAADTLNISARLVRHAKKVRAEAQPEVIQAVETGQMAVSAAAKLAEQPVPVQREVVQALETGAAKTVTAALKHVQAAANGHPVPPPPHPTGETKAEARWRQRLPEMQRYIEEVAASRLMERLGEQYGPPGAMRGKFAVSRRAEKNANDDHVP
jgi:hypothetical protein